MKSEVPALDMEFVRGQYPKNCWQWSFFENAGGSYVPNSVIERITAYMREMQVQPGSNFPIAAIAQARMEEGHARMSAMIGANKDEVVITPSTSFSALIIANALRRRGRMETKSSLQSRTMKPIPTHGGAFRSLA